MEHNFTLMEPGIEGVIGGRTDLLWDKKLAQTSDRALPSLVLCNTDDNVGSECVVVGTRVRHVTSGVE